MNEQNFFYRDGVVSLNEYTAFMISRETENVRSASEVEDAFRAITENGKQPFVTEEDLKQVSPYHSRSQPAIFR